MKNNHIKYKALMFSAIVFLAFGCKKTLDINVSPNNPLIETTTPEVLFPSAVASTTGRVGGDLTILGGIWAQYYTQANASNQYKTIDSYALTRNDFNGSYNELFSGALADYQLAINLAKAKSDWRYNLMATVMKAYTYQVLVDLYDKVPYTEALKGVENLQPKFDDGYTIYVGLLAEIDAALAKDYTSIALSGDQKKTDFLFGGDMSLWTKFANTLKLKMYLRMVNAKPAEAQAGITKLYTDGANFLTTSAGIATFDGTPDNSNPFYEYNIRRLNTTTNLRASKTFTSWLTTNNDPRVNYYFGTANPTPINQGDYTATATQQPTYASATVFAQTAKDPVWFISAAESYFMQAEALERYYGGTGAAAMYQNGVRAAFTQVGLAVGTIPAPYLVYSGVTFEQKLEQIIVQKWASFAGSHSLEGFFEQERTGYPKTSAVYSTEATYIAGQWVYSKNGVTSGLFPKRLVYPASSRDRNSNTPAEVPITTKVWWGK
ncbi:Susd and RagB outer membrane lipoprotein [compost metagenome]